MKKISRTFEYIWKDAQAINDRTSIVKQRFFKIHTIKKKHVTIGLYDYLTKKWSTFDSINLSGNYRYANKDRIPEINEMKAMIKLGFSQCDC